MQRETAEIENLQAQVRRIDHEIGLSKRQLEIEKAKALGSFITSIVAVLGVLATFYLQSRQIRMLADQGVDKAFSDLLRELREPANPAARLSATASLEKFLTPDYSRYNSLVLHLLINSMELEDNESVREFVTGVLVRHPSKESVAILAAQNRRLQTRLATYVPSAVEDIVTWSIPFQRHLGPLQAKVTQDITWNARTLMVSINALFRLKSVVDSIDLSHVYLSTVMIDTAQVAGASYTIVIGFIEQPAVGIALRRVDLRGAGLSRLTFKRCAFTDVSLDSAALAGTVFEGCYFRGSTSLESFVWYSLFDNIVRSDEPVWQGSELSVKAFSPDLGLRLLNPSNWRSFHDCESRAVYFRLQSSHWQLGRIPAHERSQIVLGRFFETSRPFSAGWQLLDSIPLSNATDTSNFAAIGIGAVAAQNVAYSCPS